MNGWIRINSTPFGEAPLWVRQSWIGIDLPLAGPTLVDAPIYGVLSSQSWWNRLWFRLGFLPKQRISGYLVEMATAVDLLRKHAPEAAAWWLQHVPEVAWRDGRRFIFDSASCQRIAANDPGKH